MRAHRENDGRLVICLHRGERLREALESLAAERHIAAARVAGIGAVEEPELGYYHLAEQRYQRRLFTGTWELLSLTGNLSVLDGRPFLHAHVSLGGPGFEVVGGHLFDARVAVVAEIFVDPLPTPIHRALAPDVGLHRWEPGARPPATR